MPGKGFLIRGTLAPGMGSLGGRTRRSGPVKPMPPIVSVKRGPGPVVNNRIPSSISMKRNIGAR